MREIYDFLRLASGLANTFGHPSQVRTQVLVLKTCVDLSRLASPFGQGFRPRSSRFFISPHAPASPRFASLLARLLEEK